MRVSLLGKVTLTTMRLGSADDGMFSSTFPLDLKLCAKLLFWASPSSAKIISKRLDFKQYVKQDTCDSTDERNLIKATKSY